MSRVLEFIVALILVFVLAVVVGVILPSHGHIERSIEVSHNMEHVVDVLNNYRRFPDYSVLSALDPNVQYQFSGKPYGVGATVNWTSTSPKVGDGSLQIVSSTPTQIVWKLDNNWHGSNKHFTIDLSRTNHQRLVKIDWAYDVDYGWNLIDRYSQLFLHGDPASFISSAQTNLQSLLANIPNIGYASLDPRLVDTPVQPVLSVSTTAQRNLDLIAQAQHKAIDQINAAIKSLGVHAVGEPVILTTNWGDQQYSFDVAIPIDTTTIKIAGTDYDLTQVPGETNESVAAASAAGSASTVAPAASASVAASAGGPNAGPGQVNTDGMLVVSDDNNVEIDAGMAFGGRALAANWPGNNPAGLPLARLGLKAYAATHGYAFNEYVHRFYDIFTPPTNPAAADGAQTTDPTIVGQFVVYLPLQSAPQETPAQIADAAQMAAAPSSSAMPAGAGSAVPAAASSAAPSAPASALPTTP